MTVQSGLQGGFVGHCFLMFADDIAQLGDILKIQIPCPVASITVSEPPEQEAQTAVSLTSASYMIFIFKVLRKQFGAVVGQVLNSVNFYVS